MQLIPLSSHDPRLKQIRELYHSSFPTEERREWASLVSLADIDPRFTLFAVVTDEADPAGFITRWDFGKFAYLEHFAVNQALRGGGVGARALKTLTEMTPKPVVFEVEPDDDPTHDCEIAKRRIGFYKRNGFALHTDFHYIQPPYTAGQQAIRLMLMTTAGSDIDLAEAAATLHREVYNA